MPKEKLQTAKKRPIVGDVDIKIQHEPKLKLEKPPEAFKPETSRKLIADLTIQRHITQQLLKRITRDLKHILKVHVEHGGD